MPAAARITDHHECPKDTHGGGPVHKGAETVFIGGMPAARIGDQTTCEQGGDDKISQGEPSVIIGGKPAARMGDSTSHGGNLAEGCPTVIISSPSGMLRTNAPFNEDCASKRKAAEAKAERRSAR
jgi:uncharacterized Zn-binding protein involved in type VI secretion